MKPRKYPYISFYTGDWLKDPSVSACSPATRGIWFDFLCVMHERDRSGVIAGTREVLARFGRCSAVHLDQALCELQTSGTADITERSGVVTVINRRMQRDAKKRENNNLRQSKHRSNGTVAQLLSLYDIDDDDGFFAEFSESVRSAEFRKVLNDWLSYKNARAENYEHIGLRAMVSRAANLAEKYGLLAVIDAMQRAMANNWAGWDHPSHWKEIENGKRPTSKHTGPGQRSQHERDPGIGKL